MSKLYDRLEYVGKCKYMCVSIYPSHKEVKITNEKPYVFQDSDILNKDSISYYKSLYSMGLRLVKSGEVFNEKPEEVNPQETPKNITPEEVDQMNTKSQSDDSSDPDKENETTQDDESVNNGSAVDPSSIGDAELVEFLDLNYDVNGLADLARAAGVNRVMSSWDKQTLISKILETNTQYVVDLIKKS